MRKAPRGVTRPCVLNGLLVSHGPRILETVILLHGGRVGQMHAVAKSYP
jgi:hypothetical protein